MSGFTDFLYAFVDNQNATVGSTLHPLMGPNGAQMWTAGIGVDRRQPPSVDSITVPDLREELVVPGWRWHAWQRAWRLSRVSRKLWWRSPA